MLIATVTTAAQWAIIGGTVVLLWVVPSIFVSATAAGEGFRSMPVFFAALFLSWPLVLIAVLIFGQHSPLVSALRRDAEL